MVASFSARSWAHILYGLILGVAYATIDRSWVKLFIESDPLNREPEGPGLLVLRSLSWGALAGLVGGVVSSPVMIATGVLPKIAGLDTPLSVIRALLLHILVSAVIGMTFGLLFRRESSSLGLGVMWGWLFGVIWWYLGPMTFLPLLLTGEIDWRLGAASALLPYPHGTFDLRRNDRARIPLTRKPLYPSASPESAHCRLRAPPRPTRGDSGTGLVVFRAGDCRSAAHSSRISDGPEHAQSSRGAAS